MVPGSPWAPSPFSLPKRPLPLSQGPAPFSTPLSALPVFPSPQLTAGPLSLVCLPGPHPPRFDSCLLGAVPPRQFAFPRAASGPFAGPPVANGGCTPLGSASSGSRLTQSGSAFPASPSWSPSRAGPGGGWGRAPIGNCTLRDVESPFRWFLDQRLVVAPGLSLAQLPDLRPRDVNFSSLHRTVKGKGWRPVACESCLSGLPLRLGLGTQQFPLELNCFILPPFKQASEVCSWKRVP